MPPGSLADEKQADDPERGEIQPETAEVESARLLANQAAEQLRGDGLSADDVRRLADEYVACDLGDELDHFVAWARSGAATQLRR